jgi:hypothetical protein
MRSGTTKRTRSCACVLLLNGATAIELARLCPWLDEVYAVPFTSFPTVEGDPAAALAAHRLFVPGLDRRHALAPRSRAATGTSTSSTVPVYSLLPDPSRFAAFRADGLSAARLRADLPELLRAARQLLAGELDYEQLLADYFPRLLAAYGGDRSRLFSFDGVHEPYLPA